MARVELKNVSKTYDGKLMAVKEANVVIDDKEFVVLVGPSGCGKSTLLRMIAGLEEISSGSLYIDERRVNDVQPKDRDIAMVFQNYALYPHMTVFDNMAFGLKLRKLPKAEIRERVLEAAELLDIQEYLDRKPKALSGGQRQRVAIGRAIVRKPKVFLFDEPLSNLDAKLRVQMRIEIKRLHARLNATMLYVTHDQVEAMTLGDKIVVLKDGVTQQVDTPLNLYNCPKNLFVAGFIGSPAMNFVKGRFENAGSMQFNSGGIRLSLPEGICNRLKNMQNENITLGVRPENILDIEDSHPNKNMSDPQQFNINVVEPMGNEVFVYGSCGQQDWCMRTTSTRIYRPNEVIQVGFDLDRVHFFDSQTQQRIA